MIRPLSTSPSLLRVGSWIAWDRRVSANSDTTRSLASNKAQKVWEDGLTENVGHEFPRQKIFYKNSVLFAKQRKKKLKTVAASELLNVLLFRVLQF